MCLLVNNKPKKNPICSFFLIHRSINSTKGNIFLVVTKRGFKLYREHKIAPFHFPEKRKHFKFLVHWDCQSCLFFSLSLHALTWTAVSPCYSPLPCLPVCEGWQEPENMAQEWNLVLWCQQGSENTKEDPDTSVLICVACVLPRKQSSPMGITMNKNRIWPNLCQSAHECFAPRITRAR